MLNGIEKYGCPVVLLIPAVGRSVLLSGAGSLTLPQSVPADFPN